MESRNPDYEQYTREKIGLNKFMKWLGYEITTIRPGITEGELVFKEIHEQQDGWLHGGVTATLLDMAAGFAAYSLMEKGHRVVTVEAKVSYYNPGNADKFYIKGWVTKPGKRFHFCEAEVYYLKEGKPVIVAKGSSTMGVIAP
jgi:uncharacterized protein (TIGR00369 family)